VSATPLREALQRLAAQNLVEIDPRMGATVVVLSRSDLHDIYWLRELLESRALVRSIARADDAWEARVRRTWEALRHVAADADRDGPDPDAWSRCHRAFHEALFSACDSPWLLRFVNTLYDHSERYRLASVRSRTRDTTEEHLGIYDPAIARDGEGAAAALRAHLKSTVALVDEGLAPDNGLHARQDEEEG
jgi:GntR family carbon starvation induced transcriptional regulator